MTQAKEFLRTQLVFGDVEFSITIDCKCNRNKAFKIMEEGFSIVHEMQKTFSPYDADTEFARVKTAAQQGSPIRLSRHFATVLRHTLDLWEKTGSAFDPTFEMEIPDAAGLKLTGRKLSFAKPGMRVNPTGVVKGYTVDLVMQKLQRHGDVQYAIVAGSGDVAVWDQSGTCHTVPLKNPTRHKKNAALKVELCNASVSTSGFYERGRHIRNTGRGESEHLQVSVVAPTTITSDGLDNALIFTTSEKIRAILKKYPTTKVTVIEKNGEVVYFDR